MIPRIILFPGMTSVRSMKMSKPKAYSSETCTEAFMSIRKLRAKTDKNSELYDLYSELMQTVHYLDR